MKYASATIVVMVAWMVGVILAVVEQTTQTRQQIFLLLQLFTLAIFVLTFMRKR